MKYFHVNAVRDKQVLWVFWLDREERPAVALFQSDRKFRQTVFLLMCVCGGLNLATFGDTIFPRDEHNSFMGVRKSFAREKPVM